MPAQLLDAWLGQRFTLVTSIEQLEEFRAVSQRPKLRALLTRVEFGRFVNTLKRDAVVLDTLPHIERSADPADDFLLAMCDAGKADYLVSGDRRGVLALQAHGATRIVTAARIMELLR
jgi:putative PIN family toxin of toxin-antitoxin system